ncbi:MAG: TIGR03768 family metallophosphoesterase [Opitutales bacterium]|jgi:metallophosphoesterase (TIGR03768 family)
MQSHHHFEKKLLVTAIGALIASAALSYGTVDADQTPHEGYPISSTVYSTVQRKVVPDAIPADAETIYIYDLSKYAANGYGVWHFEPGTDYGKRLDLMPESYDGAAVLGSARLLHFFSISDIHLVDEESPCQKIADVYRNGSPSAYSPAMMLTTQVLDAAVQTIDAINERDAFDFGIGLGDACHNSEYTELRWYIDVLDGKVITPDTGIKDDPVPGPYNDYQDSYQAAGLNPSIPWYQTLGNHDHQYGGAYPVTDYLRQFYIGTDILLLGNLEADGIDVRTTYMGVMDGSTPDGTIYGLGPVADFPDGPPQVPAADADRRSLLPTEWMNEFFTTTSTPVGHGFSQDNVTSGNALYTFEPKSDIPIRVIVLDDTEEAEGFIIDAFGYLTEARYNWLVSELDRGQADGKLMIIAAHVPIQLIGYLNPNPPTPQATLLKKLSSYPNLIMWMAGHRHRNAVTARPSIDPDFSGNEYGFWEVETASLRDFPQQFRTFDIVRNSDDTISIIVRSIDPAVAEGSLAAKSRGFSVAEQQFLPSVIPLDDLTTGPYNAELVKQLSTEMQTAIHTAGTPLYGAKWSGDWGWVDDTYYPWVWDYEAENWFYMYSGKLNAAVDDGYWIAYYTPDFSDYGWGYVYPGYGWWCFTSDMTAYWLDAGDPLPSLEQ